MTPPLISPMSTSFKTVSFVKWVFAHGVSFPGGVKSNIRQRVAPPGGFSFGTPPYRLLSLAGEEGAPFRRNGVDEGQVVAASPSPIPSLCDGPLSSPALRARTTPRDTKCLKL